MSSMKKYAFLLGSHSLLSYLEILNMAKVEKITTGEHYRIGDDILVIEMKADKDRLQKLQDLLGGTIKIIEIVDEYHGTIFQLNRILTPEKLIEDYFAQTKSKVNFGFSVYSTSHLVYAEINWLRNFAYQLKRKFKPDFSIRYVDEKNFELSSVMVTNNRLVETGAEIVLIKQEMDFMIGKTITVQDFRAYVKRDMEKPSPNAKSGMLPPKLAQMIVNLTRDTDHKQVYDPFCGSGVLLQEAMLVGLSVLGSDVADHAVISTRENLEWLVKTYNVAAQKEGKPKIKTINAEEQIKQLDATKSKWAKANTESTFVAAEPYLGPPQRSTLLIHNAKTIAEELEELYVGFFENMAKNYSKINRIGFVLPVLKTNEGLLYMNVIEKIEKLGYARKEFLPAEESKKEALATHRGSLLYSRPDQHVLREIFVFDRVK